MRKLKIAICLSGEPRLYNRILNSINIIRANHNNEIEIDIFYHLWDNVTKRQRVINEDPILENIDREKITKLLNPTVGIIDSKDVLNEDINNISAYVQGLIKKYNKPVSNNELYTILQDKDTLDQHIKYTNFPWYSQMYSLCRSHLLRIEYEKENNIKYDYVIRTRTDVELYLDNTKKLFQIKKDARRANPTTTGALQKIYFPTMYIKGAKRNIHNQVVLPVHVEYCYFLGCSDTLSEEIFKDYRKDILDYMIQVKEKPDKISFWQPTSHTFMPHLILKYKETEIRCSRPGFKYNLQQLEKLFDSGWGGGWGRPKWEKEKTT